MKFDLFNIIVVIFMIYVLYRLPSIEKMTNVDKATEEKIREIYKIDTDAIRNLSNLARNLTVDGKLVVPGGLDIKGKLDIDKNTYVKGLLKVNRTDEHPWNPGWGNGVHTWDMKVDASADINNLSVRNSVNIANDLVFNGKNNWIFHTPNDGRHVVYISPSTAQGNTTWDWGKGLELHPNGKVLIKGDLEVMGQLRVHGVSHFKNQTKDAWSHINWSDGNVYLRGNVNIDGAGGTGSNVNGAPNLIKVNDNVKIQGSRGILNNFGHRCNSGDGARDIGIACQEGHGGGWWQWRIIRP